MSNSEEIDIIEVNEPQISLKYSSDLQQSKKKKTDVLNMLSLFSGCGGMDLGFEGGFSAHKNSIGQNLINNIVGSNFDSDFVELKNTNFRTIFANDILDSARKIWINYFSRKKGFSPDIFYSDSIVDLVKQHNDGIDIFPTDVDLVTGGFPCQDFSVSGKRKGFNSHKNHVGELISGNIATEETRGKLYMWMKNVIEITSPKMFIAENVKGLVNLSNVKEIIQQDFSSINTEGYIVLEPQVLHSADYGVPQSRERVFFIGFKKSALNPIALEELGKKNISDDYNPYPKQTHSFTQNKKELLEPVALREVFKHLDEPENSDDLSQQYYSKAKFMGAHCQGQIEVKLDGIGPTIRAEHHGNIEFRRLSKENGGKYDFELNKGYKERRLTLRECGLIQTFPPDFEFVIKNNKKGRKFIVSPSAAYKVVGNAVPPLLAYNLAINIQNKWNLYFK